MDSSKGIGGNSMTCYLALKSEGGAEKAKPPVTCYAPMKAETFEKGGQTEHSHGTGKVPTATCYMPVDDSDLFGAKDGSQAKSGPGLTEKQVENRMKLIEERSKDI